MPEENLTQPDSPENHRVDIPDHVMAEIMANAAKKRNRLLGLNFIWDMMIQFYTDDIRFYIKDLVTEEEFNKEQDEMWPPKWTQYNNEYYKFMFHMNRAGAKNLARTIKGFTQTPFDF